MSNGIGKNPLNDISKVYLQQIAEKKRDNSYLEPDMKKRQANNEKAIKDMKKMGTSMKNPHFEQKQFGWESVNSLTKAYRAMQEGIRDEDPEKGTEERKKRLEKKRGMKLDDHPQYKKEELDIFDTVLEYLQVEGIAESFEDAQWVMVNVLDEEDIDSILDEARRADKEGYARGSKENPKRNDIPHGDVSQRSMLHSKLKRRADEMGRARRSSARNKAGGRTPVGKKEKAFLQAVTRTAGQVRQPNVPDTGKHKK